MNRRLLTMIALATAVSASPALAQGPYELSVKAGGWHFIGAGRGTLVFDQDGVEYRTTDPDDARRWDYNAINQLQVLGPRRVQVLTFEDQGPWKFGKDRTFDFEVVGGAVTPELVGFLLPRVDRPLVTAVMPADCGCREPLAQIRVRHEGRNGSDGMLVVHNDHLAFLTEQPGNSRYWRYADVASLLRLDPYRLVVSAYEGGAGETRPFVFDLRRPLPDDVYAMLWVRVNPPVLPAAARDVQVAGSASRDPR